MHLTRKLCPTRNSTAASLTLLLPLAHRTCSISSHPSPPKIPHFRRSKININTRRNDSHLSPSLRCNAQLHLADAAPAASAAYGTLLLGGGIFAYSRSGSKGSILGGLSGAALMAAAYYLMQSPETKQAGEAIGFGSAFLFSSVFGIRLFATRKFIPSGLLLLLSAGAAAVFYSAYLQDKVPQDIDIGPM